ncbi:hypothetical protein GF362_03995 [Candidatus Dojkabacteria bacterium]|nr:hypothetical protein [Candidatus Dojkabacteria bacterium]
MRSKLEKLLSENRKTKLSRFIRLSTVKKDKNILKLKKGTEDLELSDDLNSKLEDYLDQTHKVSSIGIFAEGQEVETVESMSFPYQGDYQDILYFLLPFFDYRNKIFDNLYFLFISKTQTSFYELGFNNISKVKLQEIEDFEKKMKRREENKSIQHFGKKDMPGEPSVSMHGQNAPSAKDRESYLVKKYIRSITNKVEDIVDQNNAKLIIAGTRENIDLVRKNIDDRFLSPIQLTGNIKHFDKDLILSKVKQKIDKYPKKFIEELRTRIDFDRGTKLQYADFIHILSVVYEAKVEEVYFGKLGVYEKGYENPISPLGANYIAQEVLRLGGSIHFYPDTEFEFSENNILFKFRKDG